MMKYQTCNLSSSSAKARDFMGSTVSISISGNDNAILPQSIKHQVKVLAVDLSNYQGTGPGQKLVSKSPELQSKKVALFDSHVE